MSNLIDLFLETKQNLIRSGEITTEFDDVLLMEVSNNIYDTVMETHCEDHKRLRETKSPSAPPIPQTARPSAKTVAVGFPFMTENGQFFIIHTAENGEIFVHTFSPTMPTSIFLGIYCIGALGVHRNTALPDRLHAMSGTTLFFIAALFDLLNTPKFTTRRPLASRPVKKRLARNGVSGSERWSKISWNLSEPKAAPQESKGGGWKMPLHYTRGHWRRSERAKNNIHVLSDGNTYQWIEGFWSGHPAYGVKKSYYNVVDTKEAEQ